ncbi:MAG: hypothetical protein VX392_02325 [Verrucomicrobiota bacterium]|nr:hypothetical protein [Verrucomicrobiota bacterium]
MEFNLETFRPEIDSAMQSYDRHVVCVFKTPDDCLESIERLMLKAMKAYENRATGMRHGIALDKEITIMLSQGEGDAPLCGIYFNLHTPYSREHGGRNIRKAAEKEKANPSD